METVIVIPTCRPAPLKTLESFPSTIYQVVILADPSVVDQHQAHYGDAPAYRRCSRPIMVLSGMHGSIPQALGVYRTAHVLGYKYAFRLDDDLQPKFFVHKDGSFPSLDEAVHLARVCLESTRTTYAGFANTSRRDWLGEVGHFKRGAGLIHGGASIVETCADPERYLDPALPAYDDVYRSASHRKQDGAVGVVSWIGLDKRESLRDTTVHKSPEVVQKSIDIILAAFPNMVTCTGTRTLDGGRQVIPNWRMKGRATQLL